MPKTKNKPIHYGLYRENDFILPDFMHCETLAYSSHKHKKIINEHLHTSLFQIFIVESGKLAFFIEKKKYLLEGPAIITIPENTLHEMKVEKGIKGKVMTVSTSFLENFFSNAPHALQELSITKIITEFDKGGSFEATHFFADNLHNEMNDDLPEKKMVLQCYFNLLLSLTYRLLKKNAEKFSLSDNRNLRYFRAFQKSVKKSYTTLRSIKQYAGELNISSVHLNRICRSSVGKPALHVVHEFLILEAEKFLKHTDLNISEIAYQLNFEDPAYFSRFFKKYTGVSPKKFREWN